MCSPATSEDVVKPKSPADSLVEKEHTSEPKKSIPNEPNPPNTTAAPPTHVLDFAPSSADHVVSEQPKTASLFIQHLLDGLITTATSPIHRPSDASQPNETVVEPPPALTSETDSSASDSDDDTNLLTVVCEESDTELRKDALLRTKHEKDENAIYISRPEFVATEQHTLVKVGTISAILDNAVVVTTFMLSDLHSRLPNSDITTATALDTGSLLCFSDGTLLGAVFETFGPVASPLYLVRFNNSDEIPSAAQVGQEIMYVEQEMCVVRARDVCQKGYDASGKDDEEVDAEEFSDDEKERHAKKMKRSGVPYRAAGTQKRRRVPQERQRRLERPPSRKRPEGLGSSRFGTAEHQRYRPSLNPYNSNQHGMRRSEPDGAQSLQAHGSLPGTVTLPQPNFLTQRAPFVPPCYPSGAPTHVPSHGMYGSAYNSHVTHTGYPTTLQSSPFSAPVAPFTSQMTAVHHQSTNYAHVLGSHPNHDQYGPSRHLNYAQQPYQQHAPFYGAGPSYPYPNYEPQSSEALNRERSRALQHRDLNPNPNIDAGWEGAPEQYKRMYERRGGM